MNNFGSGSMQTWSGGSKGSGTNTGSGNNVINSNLNLQGAFHYKLAKPISPAMPVLPLMESASPAGDIGNVNKFTSDVAGEARLMESAHGLILCFYSKKRVAFWGFLTY